MSRFTQRLRWTLLGVCAAALALATSTALAGSGVGGIFNLGVTNTVDAPTSLSGTTAGAQLAVTNLGTGMALYGRHASTAGTGPAARGDSASMAAGAFSVYGLLSSATPGVNSAAVRGHSSGTALNGYGVWGSQAGRGIGVYGFAPSGTGVRGQSTSGTGVFGTHIATSGNAPAVRGVSNSAAGVGGQFRNDASGPGTVGKGLVAIGRDHTTADLAIGPDGFDGAIEAAGPNGIEGNSKNKGGFGVSGDAPAVGVHGTGTGAGGIGVQGIGGTTGTGVFGIGGTTGVLATGTSFGVDSSVTNSGAVGIRSTTGGEANDGVQGMTSGGVSDAIQGITSGAAAFALFGITSGGGAGVVASVGGGNATGISVSAGTGVGLSATNGSTSGATIFSRNFTASGTAGNFIGDTALNVENNGTFGIGLNARVTGDTNGDGDAANDGNDAVYAQSDDTNNDAVITAQTAAGSDALSHEAIETFGFLDVNGNARVVGNLDVTGSCCMMVDHPLNPGGYYLRHGAVESPQLKNMYDGVVRTGADGRATVRLPAYFGALNKSFRYQLTVIGGQFVQAIVSKEIAVGGRTFEIRTQKPHVKVSWQVTGVRNDAYARAHPFKAVEPKTGAAAGKYLYPKLFGHSNARPLGLDLPHPPKVDTAQAVRDQNALNRLTSRKAAQARREARLARSVPVSQPAAQR